MNKEYARHLVPVYADASDAVEINSERENRRAKMIHFSERFAKRYGILCIAAAVFVIYTVLLSTWVEHRTEVRVRQDMAVEYASRLEQYKAEQAQAEQAAHWLSGDASREAAINQEVDAVAAVISKLSTDAQKLTEASCMLARVMNPSYPNSFKEVASQDSQWMFYDGSDKTFSEHDRQLAESIVRPYMEQGIVPNGLTQNHVYGAWTPNSFELREQYETKSAYKTWSYPG